jgi:hypothetical protein
MKVAFYTSTHHSLSGIYNILVRWWTQSPYSHCELVFSNGESASASFLDGGVRFKTIIFDTDKWVFLDLGDDPELERKARNWFEDHEGEKYSVRGNLRFLFGFIKVSAKKKFCSQSVAEALGVPEGDRYYPGILAGTIKWGTR